MLQCSIQFTNLFIVLLCYSHWIQCGDSFIQEYKVPGVGPGRTN